MIWRRAQVSSIALEFIPSHRYINLHIYTYIYSSYLSVEDRANSVLTLTDDAPRVKERERRSSPSGWQAARAELDSLVALQDSLSDSFSDSVLDSLSDSLPDSLSDSVPDPFPDPFPDSVPDPFPDSISDSVSDSLPVEQKEQRSGAAAAAAASWSWRVERRCTSLRMVASSA